MTHTKKDLTSSIKDMEDVYNDADTPQSVKDSIKPSLDNARKLLHELEEAEKPKATPASKEHKPTAKEIVKAISKGENKAKKARVVEMTPTQKRSLQEIVASAEKFAKYRGKSEKDLQRDAARSAKKPGTRISKTGHKYREYRANRTDVNQGAPHLAKGGTVHKKGEMPSFNKKGRGGKLTNSEFVVSFVQYGHQSRVRVYADSELQAKGIIESTRGIPKSHITVIAHRDTSGYNLNGTTSEMTEKDMATFSDELGTPGLWKYGKYVKGGTVHKKGEMPSFNKKKMGGTLSRAFGQLKAIVNEKGGTIGNSVEKLSGRDVLVWMPGVKDPISATIESASINPNYDHKSLLLHFTGDTASKIPEDKISDFLSGKMVELIDSSGDKYGIELYGGKMESGGELDVATTNQLNRMKKHNSSDNQIEYAGYKTTNLTPDGKAAFEKAIDELNREEDKSSSYYKNADKAMEVLVKNVDVILGRESSVHDAAFVHSMLQAIGISNYKTGMLLNTTWLNTQLATRKLEDGGTIDPDEDEDFKDEDDEYYDEDLGGTGHGDESYSDADPGLAKGGVISGKWVSAENGYTYAYNPMRLVVYGTKSDNIGRDGQAVDTELIFIVNSGDLIGEKGVLHMRDMLAKLFNEDPEIIEQALHMHGDIKAKGGLVGDNFGKGGQVSKSIKIGATYNLQKGIDGWLDGLEAVILKADGPEYLALIKTPGQHKGKYVIITRKSIKSLSNSKEVKIETIMSDKGYTHTGTGGGNTAYMHGLGDGSTIYITDEAEAPTHLGQTVTVSTYDTEGDQRGFGTGKLSDILKMSPTELWDKIGENQNVELFKKGGTTTRGRSRDRKFKSQEPHEQAYTRKTSPKNPVYKKHAALSRKTTSALARKIARRIAKRKN